MDALRCPPLNKKVDVLEGSLLLLKHCTCNHIANYLTITIVQQERSLSFSLQIHFLNTCGLQNIHYIS